MSTQKKIIIAVLVIALAVTMYFIFRKPKQKLNDVTGQPIVDTKTTVTDDSFPLNVGKSGQNVARLQTALNWIKPSSPLVVDGVFGPQTRIKLLTTVRTSLSVLPMSQNNFNEIIKLGNTAKGA